MSARILGRIVFDRKQADEVRDGCTIDVPMAQCRAHLKVPGRISDLIWVQEPWRTMQGGGGTFGILVGPIGRQRNRVGNRFNWENAKFHLEPAKFLRRRDSCITLEIMGYSTEGQCLRCLAHFKNIDEYTKGLAA